MKVRGKAGGRLGTPLIVLATFLVLSGLLRFEGVVTAALAVEPATAVVAEEPRVDVSAALAAVRERQAELDQREAAVEERLRALAAAEQTVSGQLEALAEAEERLRDLMTMADARAEGDIAQLTAVYENMKPKDASALFERMSPEFASGFLGRMRPDAAAAIMSGLTPDLAYAISVLLAGRNAQAADMAAGR